MSETNSTEITKMSVGDITAVSEIFFKSGMFADVKSAQQAMVKIMAGQEVGIAAFQSMAGIHIIVGKPVIGAGLIASKIKSSGKYDYKVIEMTEKNCSIDFYQGKEKIGNSSFSEADAKRSQTKNMDKYPKNMLFARAISNGVKWFCPDVFGGPVYVPEEKDLMQAETIDTSYLEVDNEAEKEATEKLNASTTLDELSANWQALTKEQRKITSVLALKESLKQKLS